MFLSKTIVSGKGYSRPLGAKEINIRAGLLSQNPCFTAGKPLMDKSIGHNLNSQKH